MNANTSLNLTSIGVLDYERDDKVETHSLLQCHVYKHREGGDHQRPENPSDANHVKACSTAVTPTTFLWSELDLSTPCHHMSTITKKNPITMSTLCIPFLYPPRRYSCQRPRPQQSCIAACSATKTHMNSDPSRNTHYEIKPLFVYNVVLSPRCTQVNHHPKYPHTQLYWGIDLLCTDATFQLHMYKSWHIKT